MIRILFLLLLFSSCNLETGKDIDGNQRSCKPMEGNSICTMSYTEGDRFADKCRKNGGRPIACGCHDYICQ